ncbi:MAG: hypothetical protein RLZZ338_3021 [Cyanobacteriota bacterium]
MEARKIVTRAWGRDRDTHEIVTRAQGRDRDTHEIVTRAQGRAHYPCWDCIRKPPNKPIYLYQP